MGGEVSVIDQYECIYGDIYQYGLHEIYRNIYRVEKWSVEKCIELFEELKEEYSISILYGKSDSEIYYYHKKINYICDYIEGLESELL